MRDEEAFRTIINAILEDVRENRASSTANRNEIYILKMEIDRLKLPPAKPQHSAEKWKFWTVVVTGVGTGLGLILTKLLGKN